MTSRWCPLLGLLLYLLSLLGCCMPMKNVIWSASSQALAQPITLANRHTHVRVTLPSLRSLLQSHSETHLGQSVWVSSWKVGRWAGMILLFRRPLQPLAPPSKRCSSCLLFSFFTPEVGPPSSLSRHQSLLLLLDTWQSVIIVCFFFFNSKQPKTFRCTVLVSLVIHIFKKLVSFFG